MGGHFWTNVPMVYKYIDLVDMIVGELKLDNRFSGLRIEYIADVEMSPIQILNDNTLNFYLELKRRDHRITMHAYTS